MCITYLPPDLQLYALLTGCSGRQQKRISLSSSQHRDFKKHISLIEVKVSESSSSLAGLTKD
jgi:hypothetical protein